MTSTQKRYREAYKEYDEALKRLRRATATHQRTNVGHRVDIR